jgi:hypothetical protein
MYLEVAARRVWLHHLTGSQLTPIIKSVGIIIFSFDWILDMCSTIRFLPEMHDRNSTRINRPICDAVLLGDGACRCSRATGLRARDASESDYVL